MDLLPCFLYRFGKTLFMLFLINCILAEKEGWNGWEKVGKEVVQGEIYLF